MPTLTYTSLLERTLEINAKDGSLSAYQYITEYADKVGGNRAQIYNFQYSLAAAAGLENEALSLLEEAVNECGYWYGYDYLNSDEDLDSLRGYQSFQHIVELCKQREEEAKNSEKPFVKRIQRSGKELLVALHGDQENITISERYWSAVDHADLAFIQSSQIEFSDGYVWDDLQRGKGELTAFYEELAQSFTPETIVLGGFSAGARIAFQSVVDEEVKVKGMILVAPWLPDLDEYAPKLAHLKANGTKVYVICGDKDDDCYECSLQLISLLKENEVECQSSIITGLLHDFPVDYKEKLNEAVAFVYTD
ncbi:alpha/beta hydrolase [Cytobacillus purgationiresistens]|uniref:Esterase n=1 Tax=Cytobacillus purgationiresistens TaxID=863449 RepID=A0ABU0AJB5_9BACI|nr:alpha/beta family hydrolase [Cytobacillus purgationiresistens]MDQ0271359.1 putative esterase [Cytobacillus purgationiresistens]